MVERERVVGRVVWGKKIGERQRESKEEESERVRGRG